MKRRTFIKMLASGTALILTGAYSHLLAARGKILYARKTDRYPGRIVPLDVGQIKKRALWSG